MHQRRGGACLALALQHLRPCQAVVKNFNCDDAIQSCIRRPIHLAHAAGTKGTGDFIGAELRSRDQWHSGVDADATFYCERGVGSGNATL